MNASKSWSEQLASWAIPREILAQAPTSPWIHPVELFEVGIGEIAISRSTELALEALPIGGSVLDIGCGGGRASMALTPPAQFLIGVDHQQEMLEKFAAAAISRKVEHAEFLGDWPEIAPDVPIADVAVAHHVIYNVSDLATFARVTTAHARKRVVLESSRHHPLSNLADLWLHFWGLTRPSGPTAQDALEVIREAGFDARVTYFADAPRQRVSVEKQVEFTRIRLCLPESKDVEIREILASRVEQPRELAAIWWETQ